MARFLGFEAIASVQRRRRRSTAKRVRLVRDAMQLGMSVSFVARQAGVPLSQLFAGKRRMLEGGHAAVQANEGVAGTSRVRGLEKRVRDLECLLGRKTMENEILKETLEVARPQINEPRGRTVKPRGPYRKADDAKFRAPIRAIVDARPA